MTNIIPVNGTPGLQNIEGEYIALKPLCEAIGIDYSGQRSKLSGSEWATMGVTPTVASDGKTREMVTLHKDSVPMWLATIPVSRLKNEGAKTTLIAYQKEAAKALNDYFTKGVAINERVYDYKAQAEVLMILKDALPADRVALKAEIITARAMGDKPQIAPQDVPLYVEDYLKEKGRKDISSSSFGRKLSNMYKAELGSKPPEEHAEIAGRTRKVKAYTEKHRYLFDRVLETF